MQVAVDAVCTPVFFDQQSPLPTSEFVHPNPPMKYVELGNARPCAIIIAQPPENAAKIANTILADTRPLATAWDELLTTQVVSAGVLSEAVSILHDRRKYDAAIEGIQSAIRNDQAAAWMYDVLALEMKLAKRPPAEIARVLESRIDFVNADIPQLLIAVALLSRFEAWDEAMRICREATELNPQLSEPWLLARSVADKSKNTEHRIWARCGILQYVWTDDSAALHEEARTVITEIAAQLDRDGNSPQAERVRERLRDAARIDLMLVLRWVGSADLDLIVTQPNGEQCSFQKRITTDGARLTHDDAGSASEGNAKRYEQYVCRVVQTGQYTATVRFVVGKASAGTAVLDIIRNSGTPQESRATQTVKLTREDVQITIPMPSKP